MTVTATVNYHVASTGRQAYHIDADGVPGRLLSPVLVPTSVPLNDIRMGGTPVDFANDSVVFAEIPTSVQNFCQADGWRDIYDRELKAVLRKQIGAQDIVVFDHTVRVDDQNADRKPARNVHSDYSPSGARQRLTDLLGEATAQEWADGHYAFVNVWRPVQHTIRSAPLGFVRPKSVSLDDWVTIDLIYPDRIGQIMGLIANENHEWVYKSFMTPDDVVIFNIYDNRGRPSIGHSALDMDKEVDAPSPRMSIESRTLVRY